jgi:hypothetical protein
MFIHAISEMLINQNLFQNILFEATKYTSIEMGGCGVQPFANSQF